MGDFTVFPAIDLRGGKVVRLAQGDPSRQTTYGDDPRDWAERWKAEGAVWLHVVNLDGAFGEDSRSNLLALERILSTGLKVEFGGGMRDESSIESALDLGVGRVFLGTAAVRNPQLVDRALAAWGPVRLAGDIGARDGKVVVKGWQESTPLTILEVGRRFRAQGLERCVLTDVSRDGIGSGANLESAMELQSATGLKVVASGGVGRVEEVRQAQQAGLAGIIVGRALYEGKVVLKECMNP
ncbi:MAG TPA: 1-(5-phosphoribosyl)-5-[(5-phosphoribosylamino)methylideneamino] imidazole-4-carboxamide isomerase [Anaerolineales bacterium]|nr:1-(5-phosphoribosyl)-5-[(5-phosphoribosylamino)methylideneamino] imidazole-4-carboxamide isomerase [Anaerolineales bacterium]